MSTPPTAWSPPLPEVAGFEHHVVETPGLRTHVASVGDGDPVLMLHGFPASWWQWRHVAPVIAARGHRVICPDLRGEGWTRADDPRIGRDTRLHDVLAVLDVLEIDRAHVVSHDLGALTAIQLSYEHPDRVRAAVQLSVPPAFMRLHPRHAPAFRHLPRFVWHRRGAALDDIYAAPYLPDRCRRRPCGPSSPPRASPRSTALSGPSPATP